MFRRVLLIAGCLVVSQANAEVSLQSVSYSDGSGLVVQGSGLGEGPSVAIHDDFDHGGRAGEVVSLNSALEGSWSGNNKHYPTLYSDKAKTGEHSAQMFDKSAGAMRQLNKRFSSPVQEVFISYWVSLGDNQMFPGSDVPGGPGNFSNDSSWKFTWLMDEDVSGSNTDIAIPTHVGGGKMMIAGNSHNLTYLNNDWWSWNSWMRISVWLDPDMTAPTSDGKILFQTLSDEHGMSVSNYREGIFPDNGHSPNRFQQIKVPGWVRSSSSSEATVHYDDVYVATGDNAAARVEIGNADRYSESTELFILSHKDWTEGQIVAEVPGYHADNIENYYVYVTNGKGEVNEKGISVGEAAPAVIDDLEVR